MPCSGDLSVWVPAAVGHGGTMLYTVQGAVRDRRVWPPPPPVTPPSDSSSDEEPELKTAPGTVVQIAFNTPQYVPCRAGDEEDRTGGGGGGGRFQAMVKRLQDKAADYHQQFVTSLLSRRRSRARDCRRRGANVAKLVNLYDGGGDGGEEDEQTRRDSGYSSLAGSQRQHSSPYRRNDSRAKITPSRLASGRRQRRNAATGAGESWTARARRYPAPVSAAVTQDSNRRTTTAAADGDDVGDDGAECWILDGSSKSTDRYGSLGRRTSDRRWQELQRRLDSGHLTMGRTAAAAAGERRGWPGLPRWETEGDVRRTRREEIRDRERDMWSRKDQRAPPRVSRDSGNSRDSGYSGSSRPSWPETDYWDLRQRSSRSTRDLRDVHRDPAPLWPDPDYCEADGPSSLSSRDHRGDPRDGRPFSPEPDYWSPGDTPPRLSADRTPDRTDRWQVKTEIRPSRRLQTLMQRVGGSPHSQVGTGSQVAAHG